MKIYTLREGVYLHVLDLRLINYRNYKNIYVKLNENINVFIGKNAQGKTNLIEAIYTLGLGKSFRTIKDREVIYFNEDESYIGSNIALGNYKKFIEIKMDKIKPKRIRINKTELKNQRELYQGLNVVIFTPEDLRIIKDGPSERRRFLDGAISQIKPIYSYNLNKYKKLLFQRNNILKANRFKKDIDALLDVFDLQISKIATSIIIEREKFLLDLDEVAKGIHGSITKDMENLEIKYRTNVDILEDRSMMEKAYFKTMKENFKNDMQYGTTGIGPHRDDIDFFIDKKDLKTYGSQGQQRTSILSTILAQLEIIKRDRGLYPILLLDDVFSELDDDRKAYLSSQFSSIQTFITTTNLEDLKGIEDLDKSIFYIDDGKITLKG